MLQGPEQDYILNPCFIGGRQGRWLHAEKDSRSYWGARGNRTKKQHAKEGHAPHGSNSFAAFEIAAILFFSGERWIGRFSPVRKKLTPSPTSVRWPSESIQMADTLSKVLTKAVPFVGPSRSSVVESASDAVADGAVTLIA